MNARGRKELMHLILGERIGFGSTREVYAHRHNPALVIKVEETAKCFQNVMEWEFWMAAQDTPLGKWLAPCVDISPSGDVLFMERISPVDRKAMPARVPAAFADLHLGNWGRLGRRVVCCDYGYMYAKADLRLKKARWPGDDD